MNSTAFVASSGILGAHLLLLVGLGGCATPAASSDSDSIDNSLTASAWKFDLQRVGSASLHGTPDWTSHAQLAIATGKTGGAAILFNGTRSRGRSANGSDYTEGGLTLEALVQDAPGGAWIATPVADVAPEARPSLHVDATGQVHTAYVANGHIVYATAASATGPWVATPVDSPELYAVNGLPQPTSLLSPCASVDRLGSPHLAYVAAAGKASALVDVSRTGSGEWDLRVVDPAATGVPACAADTGVMSPQLLYAGTDSNFSPSTLRHAWFDGSQWGTETLAKQYGAPMMAFGASEGENVHRVLGFVQSGGNSRQFAQHVGLFDWKVQENRWAYTTLATNTYDAGQDSTLWFGVSMAVASDGTRYVAYTRWVRGVGIELHLKRELAGAFVDYTVDVDRPYARMDLGASTAVAIDAKGQPVIAYRKETYTAEGAGMWLATVREPGSR